MPWSHHTDQCSGEKGPQAEVYASESNLHGPADNGQPPDGLMGGQEDMHTDVGHTVYPAH